MADDAETLDDPATDASPLLTAAAERAAERRALVRSLSRDHTGLPLKVHNSIARFLETLSSESFSDGTRTVCRVAKLVECLSSSRATVFRWLRILRDLGLVDREPRFAEDGRQLSSERVVRWDRVRELVRGQSSSAAISRQNETGRVSGETGRVSGETPINRSKPKQSAVSLRSGAQSATEATDHKKINGDRPPAGSVAVERILQRVGGICRQIGYSGRDAGSVWQIAAAEALGTISEHSVADAIAAVRETSSHVSRPVSYFVSVVASGEGLNSRELLDRVGAARVTPRNPRAAPRPKQPADTLARPRAAPRAPHPVYSDAATNAARNALQKQIAALGGE